MKTLLLLSQLITSAEAVQYSPQPYTLGSIYQPSLPHSLPSYTLVSEPEDAEASAEDDKGMWMRYGGYYSHPDFRVPKYITIAGAVGVVGGGVSMTAGVAIVILGAIPYIFLGEEGMVQTGVTFLSVGFYSAVVGSGALVAGSLSSAIVLRRHGQKAPFIGLYIMAGGIGAIVASEYVSNRNAPDFLLYGGLLAVPAGGVTQFLTNRVHYNRYIDTLAISPTLSPEGMGAVARMTF